MSGSDRELVAEGWEATVVLCAYLVRYEADVKTLLLSVLRDNTRFGPRLR